MVASFKWWLSGPTEKWSARYPSLASRYPQGGFIVVAGDLVFSVIVFTFAAITAILMIWYRRRTHRAELGGPFGFKVFTACFFVLLWIIYIALASWKCLMGEAATALICFYALLA